MAGFAPLKIGGGGAIVGHQFSDDGTMVCRTDTYGAYLKEVGTTTSYRQFLLSTAMPAADVLEVFGFSNMGVYSVAIAPSDSNRVYMMFNGRIFRSDNKGVSFVRTTWTQVTADPNTAEKGFGQYMVVDPVNPDIVFASTPANGLWKTVNGGTSWSVIGAVGTATSLGGHVIVFDRSSSVVSSATQGIYQSTYGTGVYHSTDGGVNWSLLNSAGMPTDHSHIVCASNGTIWQTTSGGTLKKYSGGTWSSPSTGSTSLRGIAIKPGDDNTVYAHEYFDRMAVTTDGGTNWVLTSFSPTRAAAADEPGWLVTTVENMSSSNIAFDPTAANLLYISEGIGMFYTNPPTGSGATVAWNSQNKGIEQLISDVVMHTPGGSPICASWDRAIFKRTGSLDSYPTAQQWDTARAINRCAHVDYCAGTPSFLAAIVNSNSNQSGYSSDGGATWTAFATVPTGSIGTAGSIAINTNDINNILWVPGNDLNPWVTTNKGASWTELLLTGVPLSPSETGWGHNQAYNHYSCCADKVDADTFYMYNYGPGGTGADPAGVCKSTNKGSTWTQVSHGNIVGYGFDFFSSRLAPVPGKSGHLFFSNGAIGGSISSVFFKRSTDHGATWTTVANVLDVLCVGFGIAAPGQSYPTVFIAGTVNSVYGIYRSDDNCSSWVNLATYPYGWFDTPITIDGDKDIYGQCYLGFTSSSFAYYSPFPTPTVRRVHRVKIRKTN